MILNDIRAAWLQLAEKHAAADSLQLIPLGVKVPAGELCAGRDAMGDLHLLVPVARGAAVEPDERSEAVQLRGRELVISGRRRRYVDLECRDHQLGDLFERLSAEICEALVEKPADALLVPGRVLSRWRKLLELRSRALGPGQTAGLFGELHVLHRTVSADPARRVDHWQAESRAVHDLRRGNNAIEVKTTTARTGRTVQIHGVGQLEPPEHGELHLVFLRVEKDLGGKSVDDLVGSLLELGVDEGQLQKVLDAIGFVPHDPTAARYTVAEERWYRVDDSFPRIVADSFGATGVPPGVVKVDYDIDLAGPAPVALPCEETDRVIRQMAEL